MSEGKLRYEARRAEEKRRYEMESQRATDRQRREALADEVVELLLNCTKDYLEGRAYFEVVAPAHSSLSSLPRLTQINFKRYSR